MLLYVSVVVASWFVTWLPLGLAYRFAVVAGTIAHSLSSGSRTAIQNNLAVVLNQSPSSPHVRNAARHAFQNNACNWVDSLRLAHTSKDEIARRVSVTNWALLEQSVDGGKGVLMIGAHVGNIDLVGQVMAARGIKVTIPVEPIRPLALFARTQRLRQSMGIRAIPAANSARELIRSLRRGEVIGIMADRNLEHDGITVQFFGRSAVVSRGPAWLATHCDAPVLCGTGVREDDGLFTGLISEIRAQRSGDTDADIMFNAQAIATEVESRIRRNPDQWCMFVPMWA